jgi:outer membrane protein assembly factor BamA
MTDAEELFQDIRIIRKNLEALHTEVAGLSKRTQEQGKHLSRADLDEVLAKVKQETSFRVIIPYEEVMNNLQQHLTTPAKLEAVLMSGLQQIKQLLTDVTQAS